MKLMAVNMILFSGMQSFNKNRNKVEAHGLFWNKEIRLLLHSHWND